MSERVRLDQLLVQRGLAPSRERAQALILARHVIVDGAVAERAALAVAADARIGLADAPRYVSRGGEKLAPALAAFAIDVNGRVALDIGSSTGGFTDVLLQRGASRVYAVDVGKGQLDWRLRNDPHVVVMERINAREGFDLPEPVDLIVADLAFISARVAVPPSFRHLRDGGDVVVLVKPQFEAGRDAVGTGGIVRDVEARRDAALAVARRFAEDGVAPLAIRPSEVRGREGNVEIFLHARKGARPSAGQRLEVEAQRAAEADVEAATR
jgi:23S rRNA (cytidine1920-2'-O)/16S rRNA (cytidine1409-2'-O)-methyltransferase